MVRSGELPLIIAHRGASGFAPENTLAAFSMAVKSGADGIEFDVRLTRDGIPVVFHDPGLKRIADSEVRISSLTTAELEDIDAGSWFNLKHPDRARRRFAGQRIPTLESTMASLKGFEGIIFVELKCTGRNMRRLVKAVGKVLNKNAGRQKLVIKSFNNEVIPLIREECPAAETAALFSPNIMRMLLKESRLIAIAKEFGADRLSLHYSLATRNLMKMAVRHGLPVTIWTADSPLWVRRGFELGVDSIITNDPAKLVAVRNGG